ncbi:uncharacterized protein HLK63_C00055 [Nakaseomyces glabratus]|nr:Purine-cytosine permease fcy21 [Nakaseomyces glabratus]OXB44849.1 hypothetical protein B1J91_C00231g [Nakaseomyces glabratus]OXB50145.1 hypothetical protein B1J92_C00231g [Nakaseomyces glabratus]UCS19147.1 uncharacterized protein GW608_C00055 [Nakaseomyces glabratus]UCS24380.1 uncharacterized protein HLK63_C00055 [Nakaseomyces glabratus]
MLTLNYSDIESNISDNIFTAETVTDRLKNNHYEDLELKDITFKEKFNELDNKSTETDKDETCFKSPFIIWLKRTLNAETKGVEPINENEKNDTNIFGSSFVWFSANLVLAAYGVGSLGPTVYHLNFAISVLTIVFFNILGLVSVSFFSVFGAELGLRQMIISRYLVGNVTARIFAALNCIGCVGWDVLNIYLAAKLFAIIKTGGNHLPLWGGCIVIVGSTVFIAALGYKFIHIYEKWSWIPNLAVFLIIISRIKISREFSNGPWTSGSTTAGNVLSFGSAIFGSAAGWVTYSADYTVYMPRRTNKFRIFFFNSIGLAFSLIFTMIVGAAAGMCAVNNSKWMELYNEFQIGGVTYALLVPNSLHGFGKFCCVILAMSTVANNVPSMYTIALSVQALWEPLTSVPRAIWTIFANIVVLGISIPACYFFQSFMQNFMGSIGYFYALYIGISLAEHCVFRRKFGNYNVNDHSNWEKLPIGFAGCIALIVGSFGVALGMAQTYWVGEIARKIGTYGGDIGFELGMSWAFLTYIIIRPIEIKYYGR